MALAQVASEPNATSRDLRRLTARLVADFGRDGMLQRVQDGLAAQRTLLRSNASDLGLTHYTLWVEPEGDALIQAVVAALGAPVPSVDDAGRPVRDTRGASTRAADALLEMLGRGIRAGDGVPAQPATQVLLTMSLEDMRAATGHATGASGHVLAPATARRLACDADLVPVVLGGPSEPLDV